MSQLPPTELTAPTHDAGLAFRLEMAIMGFLLGYWKHILAFILFVLGLFFVYGQYENHMTASRQETSGEVAQIEAHLARDLKKQLDEQLQPLVDRAGAEAMVVALELMGEPDEATRAIIEKAGDDVMAVATEGRGAEAAAASLEAAEIYRHSRSADRRRDALTRAAEGPGIIGAAAEHQLATLEFDAGQTDAALERVRRLGTSSDARVAEEALLRLGLELERAGKVDEAKQAYAEFEARWPDSKHMEEVHAHLPAQVTPPPAAPVTP